MRRSRRRTLRIDEQLEKLSAIESLREGNDNEDEREELRALLYGAIRYALTDRQRDCVALYYLRSMTEQQTADALGLDRSTVSRHLKAARIKLLHLNKLI